MEKPRGTFEISLSNSDFVDEYHADSDLDEIRSGRETRVNEILFELKPRLVFIHI